MLQNADILFNIQAKYNSLEIYKNRRSNKDTFSWNSLRASLELLDIVYGSKTIIIVWSYF